MRLKIRHETIYSYSEPVISAIQTLRLTPRNHDGQYLKAWRLELDADYRLYRDEDAFGNITHLFSIEGPIETLNVMVEGEVETRDTAGLVQGTAERFPLALFLRESRLTMPDPDIAAFARDIAAPHVSDDGADWLSAMHALNGALHEKLDYIVDTTDTMTSAAEAFAAGRGAAQDFAQVFVTAARTLGIPARYAGGYLLRDDMSENNAGHAWAEAHVPDYGWIAFDPVHDICATDRYVRVASGIDSLDAAPLRGARRAGGEETLKVKISVSPGRTLVDG